MRCLSILNFLEKSALLFFAFSHVAESFFAKKKGVLFQTGLFLLIRFRFSKNGGRMDHKFFYSFQSRNDSVPYPKPLQIFCENEPENRLNCFEEKFLFSNNFLADSRMYSQTLLKT